ncbi:hypothetical protein P0W64_02230 [Tsukamurella sp. 8F]|uniref:sensor histidine kinase n=1 Tax=unclassified Tsukamurella TaxID=2633480 RepID=UPI0023B8C871|nr:MULTISPECIES: hypothetical protein [unclassified Tsukamurella]MDF0528627.1 hypothetical protein [Tsukamurella sp. 8J]MDF0585589.1 hypothetical protein [Tsukamurella sp. 8F]
MPTTVRARSWYAAVLGAVALGSTAAAAAIFPALSSVVLVVGAAVMCAASAVPAGTRLSPAAIAAASAWLFLGPWAEAARSGIVVWIACALSACSGAAVHAARTRSDALIAFGPLAALAVVVATHADSALGALGTLSPILGGTTVALWIRLRAAQTERRRLAEEQARTDERFALAARLHDLATARLTRIVIGARALGEPAAAIEADAHAALADLRSLVLGLQTAAAPMEKLDAPTPVDGRAVMDGIATVVDLARRAGQTVTVDAAVHAPVPRATADCLTRVVDEGLTNARKHASGAPVTVTVTASSVAVANPAANADAALAPTGSGTGLRGLAARTRMLGGSLRYGPDDAGGFRLEAVFA